MTPSYLKSANYIPLHLTRDKPLKRSLMNTWHLEKSTPPTPLRPSPFSSSKRRTVDYTLVKIINTSMNIQFETLILFPSSQNLLINYKEQKSLPNLMYTGDITMFESRMDISGRLRSSHTTVSSNPPSCSLGYVTLLQHSNNSWMTRSTIWLLRDGW